MHKLIKKSSKAKKAGLFFGIMFIFIALAMPIHAYDPSQNQKIILFLTDDFGMINDFKAVRDNAYYRSDISYSSAYSIPDDAMDNPPYLEMRSQKGNILYKDVFLGSSYAPYYENINRIIMYGKAGNIIFDKTISFCNHNEICEPCQGADCKVSENSASCSDCPSGGKDSYCDLKRDGICDPDCAGMDADCTGCDQRPCFYEDSIDGNNACVYYGGEVCNTVDECSGDPIDYGGGGICCIGSCINPSPISEQAAQQEQASAEKNASLSNGGSDPQGQDQKEIADPVEIFNLSYNNSLPVEDQSKKIFCRNIGKSTCGEYDLCTGQNIYSDDEGYDCCTGDCVPLSDEEINAIYKDKFGEDYKKSALEQPVQLQQPATYVPPEQQASSLMPSFLIALAAVLIILSFIVLRRRKQAKETLQYEYDYYKRYGYNDGQIKAALMQRGWREKDIDKVKRQ